MTSMMSDLALALSRWVELSVLTKATILLMVGLAAAVVLGRARASVRHVVLAATFAVLLALPFIVVTAPRVAIGVPVAARVSSPATVAPEPPVVAVRAAGSQARGGWTAPSARAVLRFAWMSGAMLVLASLFRDLRRIRRFRRDGLPWIPLRGVAQSLASERGIRRPVEILLHEDIPAPFTCGVLHPAIVLPADAREWSEADLRRALVHEMEHVRRGDWITQAMARAACAVYWFHPLVWMAWRRLCLEAERACDDAVVERAEQTDYAEQLVSLARRLSKSDAQPVLAMANRSDLSARVSAILDRGQRRGRAGLLVAASAITVASLVVVAIAPVQAVAQESRARRGVRALDRALLEAAESGDIQDMTELLNAGANVNAKVSGDGSALIVAAREGHMPAVRLLLARGADVNMPVSGDGNPIIMAAREGHVDMVAFLLDRGASINQVVDGDENALIQASGSGKLPVVRLLVERGADVNARVWAAHDGPGGLGEWRTPLSMARRARHDAVVAYLLDVGARE